VTDADRREAEPVLAACAGRPLAVLQPGSSDPRRCWPAARFAAVGDALAATGAVVAVNGSAGEAGLAGAVIGHMRRPALDLAGRLSLGGLCGLLEGAALMVSNDTGPLHLALAVGTPSVGIFWFTNLVDGTPLRQDLLRVALSLRLHCPVCGQENVHRRCAHDPSFVDDVSVEQVIGLALPLVRASG
jgi:ADP-heptose:LPS heptosyltransferase